MVVGNHGVTRVWLQRQDLNLRSWAYETHEDVRSSTLRNVFREASERTTA